jgi:hypothetical protein
VRAHTRTPHTTHLHQLAHTQKRTHSGDDFEGLTAEERYARHKQLEEEARERMRAKFGKSGGLGSGSFGSAGIGSDPNYRPGMTGVGGGGGGGNQGGGGGAGGGGGGSTNAAGEWFASAAKATSEWTAKVGEDVKNAKVADKLKSGWSWFTQGATAVIDKAKARFVLSTLSFFFFACWQAWVSACLRVCVIACWQV